ncbi:MAG: NAD(P)/FAD-dependent oxidoreductase [Phycisphaeraceae bacterium]
MKRVDVLVVGAGVAGATAALALGRSGLSVMLVDRARFPRHKVCGCCLNSDAVAMLRDLGLATKLMQAGAKPIAHITAACHGRAISLPSQGGLSVSRFVLDAVLIDAAKQAGCEVRDETIARISAVPSGHERVQVDCMAAVGGEASTVEAEVVLVADGLAGSCTAGLDAGKRVTDPESLRGYGAHMPAVQHGLMDGEVLMRCGAGGYVGTVVLEDGSLDIAAAMRPSWVKACKGPAQAAHAISVQSGHQLSGLDDVKWTATAPLTGVRAKQWARRMFFLGDAAGYVEPFTGEGMAWAMRSARTVVPFAKEACQSWNGQIGEDWERAYQHHVCRKQWRCKLFAMLLRRPTLVSASITTANTLPSRLNQTIAKFAMPPMFRPTDLSQATEWATH